MKDKGIGRRKKILLHLLQHSMAVLAAICVALIIQNAYYSFTMPDDSNYSGIMVPWDSTGRFEDTYIFEKYFRSSISSIARMAVIKNQMETEGVYDGRKEVDIYAFVNRRNDINFKYNIGARYYLEDLIKWNEYGFEYEEIYEPLSERNSYFKENKSDLYRHVDWTISESGENAVVLQKVEVQSKESSANADKMQKTTEAAVSITASVAESKENENSAAAGTGSPTESTDILIKDNASAATEEEYIADEYQEYHEVLIERYQSVNKMSIIDCTDDWEFYNEYCQVLREASYQIAMNYAEYKELNDNYGADKTNLRYCIQIPGKEEGEYEFFTNEELKAVGEEDITAYFSNYGKYFYYYPKHLEYETNTAFPENYIRDTLSNYDYVFPENTRIWIAVDTTYPVKDFLWQNKIKHDSFMQYYILYLSILSATVLIYIGLWGYLTAKEGKPCKIGEEGEEAKIILNGFDRIPSELVLLIAAVTGFAAYVGIHGFAHLVRSKTAVSLIVGAGAGFGLFVSIFFMLVYYSLVRRLKAHVFWKYTLIAYLLKWVFKWLKKCLRTMKRLLLTVYNDSNILVRVLLPYTLFFSANAVLGVIAFALFIDGYLASIFVFMVLLLLDSAVGVMQFRENRTRKRIVEGIEEITKGNLSYHIRTDKMYGNNLVLAQAVNSIGEGIRSAVETSMKDERLKADLITNVSHDIKTPLTSIINYVDLIKRENIQDEKVKGYIAVLDSKSQRLKQLTEDLVEASKISSGNIEYQFECINFVELIHQTLGEFSEKFEEKNLMVMAKFPEEPMPIMADSRRIWRVIENLYNNICKYAMPGTRVYMDMTCRETDGEKYVSFHVKNISAQPLNINADELTERFIRGDVSRNTEGSGLGLSIAKNLTQAQNGSFTIYLDGDLFKVILEFPLTAGE